MPTLADVGRVAGVSRGTVSNVFNHPELVKPALRARVEAAARQLGYDGPNPRGRVLRDGKVNAIGVVPAGSWGVVDSLGNPVFRQFLLGIGEVCDEVGANLVIIPDKMGNGGIRTALVDGFILSRIEHLAEIESARLRQLPFAVMDVDPGPDVSSVRVDARAGCFAAGQHLTSLGHRRFGIISFLRDFGPPRFYPPGRPRGLEVAGMPLDQEKLRGYADALAEVGIAIDDVPIVQAHPWEREAARMMLDVAPDATAILSMSAMQGIAIMEEARRRGRSVPGDLSVVGFNDIPEAAQADPPLTTVDGLGTEKGRVAARIVFEGGPPRCELLQTRLLVRSSTAPPLR
ncbi:LacI family DNA-binding transcriptional regulator [Sinorhizobium arboris]|uniref:LacI family DNA-binding transcriptional regulator n=1 Tax=Sinorhizobium arboris TaxID=76745 RepID=UPI0004807DFA|nr:LacI family DNA-binding transcriptional regulator [Sinorhizobium arboris]